MTGVQTCALPICFPVTIDGASILNLIVMSKKKVFCFGSGFRKFEPVRSINIFLSQRPEEIALQVDPIESFRFEKIEFSENQVSYRIRSDVSMLLHAADLAKRVGVSTAQRFMDSKRSRSSSLQEQLDKLNPSDDELLSMVKSRHLQHPGIVTGKQIGRAHV